MDISGKMRRNFTAGFQAGSIVRPADGFYNTGTADENLVRMQRLSGGRAEEKRERFGSEDNMASFLENKEFVVMTIILLLLSILCRFITGIFLNSLIKEAENMSTTQNRLLKQCKVKFRNCYKLNDGVPNIPVFVEKFMGKIQIGRFSVEGLSHLSGQMMLLAVLSAGLGACAAIIDGKALGEILPFYLMSFLGLYLYFSISGLVDLDGKKELLKISLTDFLENHMAPRLAVLEESERMAEGGTAEDISAAEPFAKKKRMGADGAGQKRGKREKTAALETGHGEEEPEAVAAFSFSGEDGKEAAVKSAVEERTEEQVFSKTQEKELEELLKEFFA